MCVPAIHSARSVGRALAVGDEVSLEVRKVAPLCAFTLCCPVCLPAQSSNEILGYERLRVRRIVKRYVAHWNVTAARRSCTHPPDKVIRNAMAILYAEIANPIVRWTIESYARMVNSRKNFYNALLDENSIETCPRK